MSISSRIEITLQARTVLPNEWEEPLQHNIEKDTFLEEEIVYTWLILRTTLFALLTRSKYSFIHFFGNEGQLIDHQKVTRNTMDWQTPLP